MQSQPHTPIVFISLEAWDEVWRRNQFIVRSLAERGWGPILYIIPPRDVSYGVRSCQASKLSATPIWSPAGLDHVFVCQPTKVLPNSLAFGRLVNESLVRSYLRRLYTQFDVIRPILWVNDHSAVHLVNRVDHGPVIYDVTDDWSCFGRHRWVRERTARQDQQLCQAADLTIVCSERLYKMKAPLTRNLELVPNGVDVTHYTAAGRDDGPLPSAARTWPRPVFGYTGTVHPDRVNLELVLEVAQRVAGTLVFIGPNLLTHEQNAKLRARQNVVMYGPVPYVQIPQYMRAFDVCMVPHHVTEFTESLNPIKLWEYLASGKPIVSTPVAGFRDYPHLVRLAGSAVEFADALNAQHDERLELATTRRQEALCHTWESRVDTVETLLRTCLTSAAN